MRPPPPRRGPSGPAAARTIRNFLKFEIFGSEHFGPKLVRTDSERSTNGSRTVPERTPNGCRTDLLGNYFVRKLLGQLGNGDACFRKRLELRTKILSGCSQTAAAVAAAARRLWQLRLRWRLLSCHWRELADTHPLPLCSRREEMRCWWAANTRR